MIENDSLTRHLLNFQKNEITEYHIYQKLAKIVRPHANQKILEKIANDELKHYRIWQRYTQSEVSPARFKIWLYYLICRIFGFTFGIKLMEKGEEQAQQHYQSLQDKLPDFDKIIREESEHEDDLINLLDEERLHYTGSIVLGLNDALIELTGALAGFTLALQNTKLIALTGSITGIAAALSMAASEYLSIKSEKDKTKMPLKASIYTGNAYLVTVVVLILPYLLLNNLFFCLGCSLLIAVVIIGLFNYYLAVAQDLNFKARFLEMITLSLGVASVSFFIGLLLHSFIDIEI